MTNNYFSYANTHFGIVNYSADIFNPRNFDKIYVVKGVFAQDFITAISKKFICECFVNPINPEKSDGVIINRTAVIESSLAAFDDSRFPAVIINLGEFCDESLLNNHKEQLFNISGKQLAVYSSAQRLLKAANELVEYLLELSGKYLDEKKLIAAIDRIFAKRSTASSICNTNGCENTIADDYRFINSSAAAELNTLENQAGSIFYISNDYFAGFHFMRLILKKTGGARIICPDALAPKRIRAAYIKEHNIFFKALLKPEAKIFDEKYNYINMERFINPGFKKEHKQKLKFAARMYNSLIEEISDYFTELKNTNSELEKIYASSADFAAQKKFTAEFIKKL